MLKWVIIAAVVYMLFRMFQSEQRKKAEKTEKDNQKLVATGELIKDPVCGTYVEAASAISVREGDTVHRFCSYECRDVFLRTKGKELTADSATSGASEDLAGAAEPDHAAHSADSTNPTAPVDSANSANPADVRKDKDNV